jgi:hypothetical protein
MLIPQHEKKLRYSSGLELETVSLGRGMLEMGTTKAVKVRRPKILTRGGLQQSKPKIM